MKILIIGGTGNISRWLTHALAESGADITLYNRGTSPLPFPGKVSYLRGDRTDQTVFRRQMEQAGLFDCVIDMVGFEPEEASLAVELFKKRTAQFIFCSTVDVFSKLQLTYPVPDSQPIDASPAFPYAYKKMQMEKVFRNAFESQRFPVTIIRPAATYSEGFSPLLTPFGRQLYHLQRLQLGLPVILHGDGNSIWVETHASDVAAAFTGAVGNPQAIGKSYNVTGDELLTWRSMSIIVAEELGAPEPEFVHIPSAILGKLAPEESSWCLMNFRHNNIFDNTAAKRDLGFKYTVPFNEGVTHCIQHLREKGLLTAAITPRFYEEVLRRWQLISHIN